jgi:hydroxymethylpyrimidine pyrophosphatase-like HAD family hydrolase
VPLDEVEALFEERGIDVRLVDNGITQRRSPKLDVEEVHTYHLIPRAAGKGRAVATHMRRRGFAPEQVIAIGDSRGDLEVADVVGRFFLVANALDRDPEFATGAGPNVSVTEEPMTAGFYEAIVRTLAER